jgi:hypothetical protein
MLFFCYWKVVVQFIDWKDRFWPVVSSISHQSEPPQLRKAAGSPETNFNCVDFH